MPPATSIARHSRVHSSTIVRHVSVCRFAQVSNTKSYAHTWFRAVGGSGRAVPWPPGAGGADGAPAAPRDARVDGPDRGSSHGLPVEGKSESADIRNAGTGPPNDASRLAPAALRRRQPQGGAEPHPAPAPRGRRAGRIRLALMIEVKAKDQIWDSTEFPSA